MASATAPSVPGGRFAIHPPRLPRSAMAPLAASISWVSTGQNGPEAAPPNSISRSGALAATDSRIAARVRRLPCPSAMTATRIPQAPSALKSSTSFFTASQDLAKATFSSGRNSTSTIFSTPPAPITTGTPT